MVKSIQVDPAHIEELMRRDWFSPEELSELLDMSAYRIRHAVREGHLLAATADHHIISIRREDVIEWLKHR